MADLRILLEKRVQPFEDGCLPLGQELRLDVMLATQLRRTSGAGQQIENHLRFELRGERPTRTRHDRNSLRGPVKIRLLVQRKGRTTSLSDALCNYEGASVASDKSTECIRQLLRDRAANVRRNIVRLVRQNPIYYSSVEVQLKAMIANDPSENIRVNCLDLVLRHCSAEEFLHISSEIL